MNREQVALKAAADAKRLATIPENATANTKETCNGDANTNGNTNGTATYGLLSVSEDGVPGKSKMGLKVKEKQNGIK